MLGPFVRPIAFDRLTAVLALGVCLCVALLGWSGYRGISEWRSQSIALATQRSVETADLLYEAVLRDMGGFQASVLNSPEWTRYDSDRPHELNEFVASAFARYPYPNSLFAWRPDDRPDRMIFFYRTERRPRWLVAPAPETAFPIALQHDRAIAHQLVPAVTDAAAHSRRISITSESLGGAPHQIVLQLFYADEYRQRLSVVVGFTIDLEWIRQEYFTDLVNEIWHIGQGRNSGLGLAIADAQGKPIAGSPVQGNAPLVQRRAFRLLFVDTDAAPTASHGFSPEVWGVVVGRSEDAFLFQDAWEADIVLALAAASALTLAIGLFLVVRAEHKSAKVSTMRSDFVSAATHELKTPIATIRTAAETLSMERLTQLTVRQCSRIVLMEANRLGRVIENMLAYSRIVEAADTYTFTSVAVAAIFNDIQEDFEARLDRLGLELDWDIGPDVSDVRGDRVALRLLFGNLLDNATKYSGEGKVVHLSAERRDRFVSIAVIDHGIGIPADEVSRVTQKFARGRNAPGGGTGLGLAIAGRIARDHGGTLSIESAVSVGTTVRVSLPAA
jgi:signal transduction histidine kinase